ncbi:hypothetical protein C8J56DRAFT_1174312 [Mycena floridula]|nr:hypothetical protein C8J56DRAFT_1174312 [Mycena floridula]
MYEDPCCVLDEDPPTDEGLSEISTPGVADGPRFIWTTGDTITIKFLNGDATFRAEVQKYVNEWVAPGVANLIFNWVNDSEDALVRVKLMPSGSGWSQSRVGKNCRNIFHKQSTPTSGVEATKWQIRAPNLPYTVIPVGCMGCPLH